MNHITQDGDEGDEGDDDADDPGDGHDVDVDDVEDVVVRKTTGLTMKKYVRTKVYT